MRLTSHILGLLGALVFFSQCSSSSDPGPGSGGSGGGGGSGGECMSGKTSCNSSCVDTKTDANNCDACGKHCGNGQSCTAGNCECSGDLKACGSSCVNTASDGMNCGTCATACSGDQVCSMSKCSSSCASGETKCGNSCAVTATDVSNCGACDKKCGTGQSCSAGMCTCPGNQTSCNGACIDTSSDSKNCGGCGKECSSGQTCSAGACSGGGGGSDGGTPPMMEGGTPPPAGRNNCPVKPGMIADFEEGMGTPALIKSEDRTGAWETFNDKAAAGVESSMVEASGGTADCDKWALHIKGSGFIQYAGAGFSLVDLPSAPKPYNATTHKFTGVRFKAKLGPTHGKAPVRFNISTPWTEDPKNPGGACVAGMMGPNKSATMCYQHVGKYLPPGTGENELGTSWKTYSYCFDRDLYPLSLPSNLTNEQRATIGTNILKMQVQFNQGKDYSGMYPSTGTYPPFVATGAFDVWLDDISFFDGDCPTAMSPSNGSPKAAFPKNAAVGTCAPATDAAKFNTAIAQAYQTWITHFVQTDHVVAPEQNNVITSEALGYGMLITAAMGDKALFDKFHGYVKSKGGTGSGLMTWSNSGSGSATDGDEDIAYALYMADAQWGGYKTDADAMAAAILASDIFMGKVSGGSSYHESPFNPSYFAPAAYRKFGTAFASVITKGYDMVNTNVSATTAGIPTDWGTLADGSPQDHGNAQVTNELTSQIAFGYDAARVPWRLGLDACTGGTDKTALTSIIGFFAGKYDMGSSIDLLKAGWDKKTGMVDGKAKDLQGSFIGPMGAGAMAAGNAVMRDRAFRTILDILESGDFNHTYFPSTVGLLTALMMSGNFPAP